MTSFSGSTSGIPRWATAVTATAVAVTATAAVSPAQAVVLSDTPPVPPVTVAAGSAVKPSLSVKDEIMRYEIWPEATRHLNDLSKLEEDHNGEGASKPDAFSIETAIAFVRQLPFYAPEPLTGVGSDGYAVVEFHEDGEFGQIVFFGDCTVDVYYSRDNGESVGFHGDLTDIAFQNRFSHTFGFRPFA